MAWEQTPYTVLFAAVAVAMLAIAVLSYRHRHTAGALPLSVLSLATALWVSAAALSTARTDLFGLRLFANATYFGITIIPVALLYFAIEYTGHDVALTRYGPGPLLVIPAITLVLAWTNPVHKLMWSSQTATQVHGMTTLSVDHGPWFLLHSVYSYLLVSVATYLLVRMLLVSDTLFQSQTVAILVGIAAPGAVNAAFLTGVLDVPVDPTPLAFSVTSIMFLVAVYRHHILEIVPVAREVAREELMDNLIEAVFILDDRRHISDYNERARELAGSDPPSLVGQALDDVLPDLADALDRMATDDLAVADTRTEVALRQSGSLRHYDVRVTELHRGAGLLTGTLVSLRDVTDRRQREQRLDVLNRALRHDLRNEANVILGYAELGMQNHPDAEWVQAIQKHVSGMVDLSGKVRQLEQALDGENVDPCAVDMAAVVRTVVADIEHERPDLTVETDLPDSAYVSAIELVDSAVENALENAIEHNDNPDPLVEVSVAVHQTGDGDVAVVIADNGPGIHEDEREVLLRGRETQLEHVSGLGLWIINWIVTESGGTIDIEDNDPHGSIVTIRLPAVDDQPDAPSANGDRTTGPAKNEEVELP